MSHAAEDLAEALDKAAARLRDCRVADKYPRELEHLSGQVGQPSTIAVVGRVKAGKSTFVNALLGEDLAKVGATETTATINVFRFGQVHLETPARCHWRDGRITEETTDFVNGLQGNDPESLKRASQIERVEYRLPSPYLEHATIIDTPGLASVVDDHQNTTAELLALESEMRKRNEAATERLAGEADAVIYLVGQVARAEDRDFLHEFQRVAGGRACAVNSLGVLAKVDVLPALLERRYQLAEKIEGQLSELLNTVLPVSAGLQRALDALCNDDCAELRHLQELLSAIPQDRVRRMLANEELFTEFNFDDCPVSAADRRAALGDMPWRVFAVISEQLLDGTDISTCISNLEQIAGFQRMRDVLQQRFFDRGSLIRSYRILGDARRAIDQLRRAEIDRMRQKDLKEKERVDRFLDYLRRSGGDENTRDEMIDFFARAYSAVGGRSDRLQATVVGIARDLDGRFHRLELDNWDLMSLHALDDDADLFTPAETEELRRLFGLNGISASDRLPVGITPYQYLRERQFHWRMIAERERGSSRGELAWHADRRYNWIWGQL